jgi:hypothetical protein
LAGTLRGKNWHALWRYQGVAEFFWMRGTRYNSGGRVYLTWFISVERKVNLILAGSALIGMIGELFF